MLYFCFLHLSRVLILTSVLCYFLLYSEPHVILSTLLYVPCFVFVFSVVVFLGVVYLLIAEISSRYSYDAVVVACWLVDIGIIRMSVRVELCSLTRLTYSESYYKGCVVLNILFIN